MECGFFSLTHVITLFIGAGLIIGLYYILKQLTEKNQHTLLFVLSFAGIAAILFNLFTWGSPLEYLPFHLCSLNAMVLPFAVYKKHEMLSNLLLLWSLGALVALVINSAQAHFEIFSLTFFFYFFPHVLEFGIPILLFKLGYVKKRIKYIWSTVAITLVAYIIIHIINVIINNYCLKNGVLNPSGEIIQVNYMFSITPENPLLALFYSWIPYPFWYMIPVILVVTIYLCAIYAKELIEYFKSKKANEDAPAEV